MKVPYFSFSYVHDTVKNALREAFDEVIASNIFLLGTQLHAFEKRFSEYCSVDFTIGTGSGYDALFIALKSLGLKSGDEVIAPAHTFIASWHAIANAGLRIMPVDVSPDTFNLKPEYLDQVVGKKVKVVMPVHMYGQMCAMDEIMDFCGSRKLFCVEDFAQSHGALYKGRKAGSIGDLGATSFYPVKNLGALGDGGAITTNSAGLHDVCRRLRNYGSDEKYYYADIGVNSRLGELQAALLNRKMRFLDQWNEQRRKIASLYIDELKGIEALRLPEQQKENYHVYHLFVIMTRERDKLKKYLHDRGIETLIHYPRPPHLQSAYRYLQYKEGDFPVAERIAEEALSLPCYPGMPEEHQHYIIDRLVDFYK